VDCAWPAIFCAIVAKNIVDAARTALALAAAESLCEDARHTQVGNRDNPAGQKIHARADWMTSEESTANAGRIDALVEAVLAVHGARLDSAQQQLLRDNVERLRGIAEQLDNYPLENADEPDASFQAVERMDAV
jgi:hypothetical protein